MRILSSLYFQVTKIVWFRNLKRIWIPAIFFFLPVVGFTQWSQTGQSSVSLRLYPNPGDGIATLSGTNAGDIIDIYDSRGTRLYRLITRTASTQINWQGWPAGIYHIVVRHADGAATQINFVKK